MRALLLPLLMLTAFTAQAWELSDVSVLVPMPKNETEKATLLTPQGLIPSAVVSALPQLHYNNRNADLFQNSLRVLGIRFDACFTEGEGPQPCRRQIRLVWQPIKTSRGKLVTLDAPVHTFHEFDQAGWDAVVAEYKALLNANPVRQGTALVVNPRIKAQGLNGAFHKGLKKLVTKHCVQGNFTRLTLMSLHPGDNEWNFMGWDIVNGQMRPIVIAQIDRPTQNAKTKPPVPITSFDLLATVKPEGFSRVASAVFVDSPKAKRDLSPREVEAFAKEILHIDNPRRSNPGTVDCASCHLAGPGAQWLKLNFPQLVANTGFLSKRDLTNSTINSLKPRRMRAFGYFYDEPLISQRTINESAEVADSLDKSNTL